MVALHVRTVENVDIPPLPFVARRAVQMAGDDKSSIEKLAKLIESDAGIAMAIMRLAHSTLYGGASQRVSNLQSAITRIGMAETRSLVVAVASKGLFRKFSVMERRLWEHALLCGLASRWLVSRHCPEHLEYAFLAGQMHDVGMTIANNMSLSVYSNIRLHGPVAEIAAAEKAALGFVHQEVGAILARQWGLPDAVEAAALLHDEVDTASSVAPELARLVACVSIADTATSGQTRQLVSEQLDDNTACALQLLDIPAARYPDLIRQLFDVVNEARAESLNAG
jgi:HD-like signal output (HDOD) protein